MMQVFFDLSPNMLICLITKYANQKRITPTNNGSKNPDDNAFLAVHSSVPLYLMVQADLRRVMDRRFAI